MRQRPEPQLIIRELILQHPLAALFSQRRKVRLLVWDIVPQTEYLHMSRYIVSMGQKISAGQTIGYVGSTGISTGPHLHFAVKEDGNYTDPMPYLEGRKLIKI